MSTIEDDADEAALLAALVEGIAIAEPATAAEQAAAVADLIEDMDEGERRKALAAEWPTAGLMLVMECLEPDRRAPLAADLMASGRSRASLLRLSAEALARTAATAADAAQVLPPNGVAGTLLAAFHATGGGAAYARAIAASGPAPVASIGRTPVPSEVSRLIAALQVAVAPRFGEAAGQALATGHLGLRVLAPALDAAGAAEAAAALRAAVAAGDPDLDLAVEQIAEAGLLAEEIAADGEDPDSLVVQRGAALRDIDALHAAFADPSPADPLGTLPALPMTKLGLAIAAARRHRATDYDWSAVVALQEADPDGFSVLLADERCAVLDLARPK